MTKKTMIIISGKAGLESSSFLADYMKVNHENPFEKDNFSFKNHDVVFKYGVSKPIKVKDGAVVLNKSGGTKIAVDKIKTFEALAGEDFVIPYTTDINVAKEWVKKGTVVARALTQGHDGEGVTFCESVKDLEKAEAKFYTKYIKHTNEFRVNVWRDTIVTVYDKKNDKGVFKFSLFKGIETHPQLKEIATKVYEKTKLDWYGLDLLRDAKGKLHLLEINSSPVLYPITLKKLAAIIEKEYNV